MDCVLIDEVRLSNIVTHVNVNAKTRWSDIEGFLEWSTENLEKRYMELRGAEVLFDRRTSLGEEVLGSDVNIYGRLENEIELILTWREKNEKTLDNFHGKTWAEIIDDVNDWISEEKAKPNEQDVLFIGEQDGTKVYWLKTIGAVEREFERMIPECAGQFPVRKNEGGIIEYVSIRGEDGSTKKIAEVERKSFFVGVVRDIEGGLSNRLLRRVGGRMLVNEDPLAPVQDGKHVIVKDTPSYSGDLRVIEEVIFENEELHSTNEPAYVMKKKWSDKEIVREEWYSHGLLHREDGPAVIDSDGTKEWYEKGCLHRKGGPAVIIKTSKKDGFGWKDLQLETWYSNGKKHREDGPAVIRRTEDDESEEWYRENVKHRDDGPAVTRKIFDEWDGEYIREWWSNGVCTKKVRQSLWKRRSVK